MRDFTSVKLTSNLRASISIQMRNNTKLRNKERNGKDTTQETDFLTWNIQAVVTSPFCGFVIRVRGTAVLFEGPRYTPLFLRRTVYKPGRETGFWKCPGDLSRRLLNGTRTWCVTLLSLSFVSFYNPLSLSLSLLLFTTATCIFYFFPKGSTTIYLNISLSKWKSPEQPCIVFSRSMSSCFLSLSSQRNVENVRTVSAVLLLIFSRRIWIRNNFAVISLSVYRADTRLRSDLSSDVNNFVSLRCSSMFLFVLITDIIAES